MFTCAEVAAHYAASAARCEGELSKIVATVVETGAGLARTYIGARQEGWDPLSDATIYGFRHERGFWVVGKQERGFSGPDYEPLKGDTGDLLDSIDHDTIGLTGTVGSTSKIGLYQEMGTPNARYPMPPRPFLARGLQHAVAEVFEPLIQEVIVDLMVPKA